MSEKSLGEMSVIDFIENILKAILEVLELDLRPAFNALMEPLMDLALALNPLPDYKETSYILDGDKPMRLEK